MTSTSFDRLLKSSRLAMPAIGRGDDLVADRSIQMTRPDRDRLEGKVNKSRGGRGGSSSAGKLTRGLSKRLGTKPARITNLRSNMFGDRAMEFDRRQRAVVKIHYFNHAGGGAAGLRAHGKYIARDAATRDDLSAEVQIDGEERKESRQLARSHAAYLDRQGKSVFYDAHSEGIDGAARLESWAKADRRHFRLILSAEEGARLNDLPSYARQVMARASVALGTTLSWVAVDHHDTDNPHTHLIVRGRRANGQDLVLPKDLIKHGFRGIARDVATEWLGQRTREDERLALDRETRRHAPTRLDRMIEAHADNARRVRVVDLNAPNGDHALAQAMKVRARELERMGLGQATGREIIQLAPDWRERLQAMERHIDIRKRIIQERMNTTRAIPQIRRDLGKGLER